MARIPEIISPIKGAAPDTLIIPFRYISPYEVARRTGGEVYHPRTLFPMRIDWGSSEFLYGIENTLRAREEDASAGALVRDDGRDAGLMVGKKSIGLFMAAIIMSPRAVIFVPRDALNSSGVVKFGYIEDTRAEILDVCTAIELISRWTPELERESASRLQQVYEKSVEEFADTLDRRSRVLLMAEIRRSRRQQSA